MKHYAMVVATAALVLQAAFVSLSPPAAWAAPQDGALLDGPRFTVGIAGASWGREDIEETADYFGMEFKPKLRPVLSADLRVNDRVSVGGWWNPVAWDMDARDDMSGWGRAMTFEGSGNMFELHGTADLGNGFALQAGLQSLKVDWDPNGSFMSDLAAYQGVSVAGLLTVASEAEWRDTFTFKDEATKLVLWGLKTYRFGAEPVQPLAVTLGAGVAQGLSGEYETRYNNDRTRAAAAAKDLTVNAMVGGSYAVSPKLNANVSVWFADFNSGMERSLRFTFGVTGRF